MSFTAKFTVCYLFARFAAFPETFFCTHTHTHKTLKTHVLFLSGGF